MAGQFIAHYRVLQKLGAGGMGEVFLAEDTKLGRKVALKLLPQDSVSDGARRLRFRREAQAASLLNHPNICIIHEVGETEDGRPFIVMEYVEGETLETRIKIGPLEMQEILNIAVQIADALDGAFAKRIVHRDLKPSNVSITERGLVKVLDFGLAKRLDIGEGEAATTITACETETGQILGTANYMSPEQAKGRGTDHRSDLFSLGIVLYQMITGRLPFSGAGFVETLQYIVQKQPEAMARFNYLVPPELDRIVRKLLEKDPENRFQTPRELLVDLKRLRRDLEDNPAPAGALTLTSESPAMDNMGGQSSTTVIAPLSAEALRNSDVFINYAKIDDQSMLPHKHGWVSQFHRNLAVRVEQLSGEKVKMVCEPGSDDVGECDTAFFDRLPNVKAMVSILSPPFVKTEGCRREVEEFWHAAQRSGQLFVDNQARLLKVVKTPVDPEDFPSSLVDVFSRLQGFEFFERDAETGRLREFDEAFGDTAKQRYYERVYDLAYSLCQLLKRLRAQAARSDVIDLPASGNVIFLATTTSDLQRQRDQLQRELMEAGHQILPAQALPVVASDLETAVRGCLEGCDLSIHLIGDRYGLVPEDTDLSIVALQNKWAAEMSRAQGLDRLIWIPRENSPRDQRQGEFIRDLTRDPEMHLGAEIVADTLENFKELIEDKWKEKPPPESGASHREVGEEDPPRVYIICDARDEQAIEALEDYFYAQGIEVITPAFEAEEAKTQEMHIQNLKDCDAVLVYFGAAGKSWVDIKVRDLAKANGYRDAHPIRVKAVYLAPPFDRRKERYQSLSADVIRQDNGFAPALLEAFLNKVRALK